MYYQGLDKISGGVDKLGARAFQRWLTECISICQVRNVTGIDKHSTASCWKKLDHGKPRPYLQERKGFSFSQKKSISFASRFLQKHFLLMLQDGPVIGKTFQLLKFYLSKTRRAKDDSCLDVILQNQAEAETFLWLEEVGRFPKALAPPRRSKRVFGGSAVSL